jgi:hypothetical protein
MLIVFHHVLKAKDFQCQTNWQAVFLDPQCQTKQLSVKEMREVIGAELLLKMEENAMQQTKCSFYFLWKQMLLETVYN